MNLPTFGVLENRWGPQVGGVSQSEVLGTQDPARGARIIFPRALSIVARVGVGRLNKERSID